MNKSDVLTITTGKINTVNDTYPGGGTDAPGLRQGQLGAAMQLNAAQALALSDTSVGTLYAGVYQYVQFLSTQSGTTVKGGPMYWSDLSSFIVTADVPTGAPGFCGVALNVVSKGSYGFILVEGECQCQPLDNTTKGTPAIGDTMVTATIGRFDDLADATAFDGTNFKLIAGQWITAPADATSTRYLAYVQFAKRLASSI